MSTRVAHSQVDGQLSGSENLAEVQEPVVAMAAVTHGICRRPQSKVPARNNMKSVRLPLVKVSTKASTGDLAAEYLDLELTEGAVMRAA
jgi:hypothetical protein